MTLIATADVDKGVHYVLFLVMPSHLFSINTMAGFVGQAQSRS